jgi:hypothetical protein
MATELLLSTPAWYEEDRTRRHYREGPLCLTRLHAWLPQFSIIIPLRVLTCRATIRKAYGSTVLPCTYGHHVVPYWNVNAHAVRIVHESMRGIDELVGNAHSQGSCSVSLCLKAWRLWQGFRKLNAGVEGEVLRWEGREETKDGRK